MELIVQLEDRQERVLVEERSEGRYRVSVGERAYLVDLLDCHRLLSLLIEGRQAEVAVRRAGTGAYRVSSAQRSTEVRVTDPLSLLAERARGGSASSGTLRVDAYMPGRVVTILVEEGDRVEPGQGVVVLEAMKMENEIRTEIGGVVGEIFVEEGQAVEGGDPLFELRSAEEGGQGD